MTESKVHVKPKQSLFPRLQEALDDGKCVLCQKKAVSFSGSLSEREFFISGLCETCQAKIFNKK